MILFVLAVHSVSAQHATLQGKITSEGHPVPHAKILLHNASLSFHATVDANGVYSIARIPQGNYILVANATGFNEAFVNLAIKAGVQIQHDFQLAPKERNLNTVQVTHERYKKEDDVIDVKKIANPTLIIDKKTIQQMGSRRLDEVLREQTGMAIVNDLGSGNRSVGLQMQGFSSDYILVLLNGQPMTGRFNGNFDISRISVAGIERVEVIKGAASSLYGSEALGGVINIITKQNATQQHAKIGMLYGTYNTIDANVEGETQFAKGKGATFLGGDFYKTGGFNVNTEYLKDGQTAPPYHSINLQGRARYQLNEVSSLLWSGRFADRQSVMTRNYGAQPFDDRLDERDFNTSISINNQFKNQTRLLTRYYLTHYSTQQAVQIIETGKILQDNRFSQNIHRLEVQAGHDYFGKKLSIIAGAGGDYQALDNSVTATNNNMFNYFGYLQANITPSNRVDFVVGARYDGNDVFGGRLNPSIGAHVKATNWFSVKGSVGQGFKAPTYAQMYQVFTNIAQGYTVVGANNFSAKVAELQQAGMIQSVWSNAAGIKDLQPETSTSYNLTLNFTIAKKIYWSTNGFYNNIRNLINTEQVGIMRNGQQLFSYLNISTTFTRGIESSVKYSPINGLNIAAGYQYLVAKNKDIIDSIKQGIGAYAKVRANNGIRTATTADYFGLPNRSKHMLNLQVYYTYAPWGITASVRANYRGKYGFLDIDNNGYIDTYDVFVDGYTLVNASLQKTLLKRKLTVRVAVDNISNYTDYLMPSQPGRTIMAGFSYIFTKGAIE